MRTFLEAVTGEYMTRKVKTVPREVTLRDLKKMFDDVNVNAFPVRENDDITGLVTKFDLLKCFAFTPSRNVPAYEGLMSRTVADIMTAEFIYVNPSTRLTRVVELMVNHRMKSIPVLNTEQRLMGIIAREDVMRALAVIA